MHDKILTATKQNLAKMKFPFIDMFDHTGPGVVRALRGLLVGVFEHLEITSPMIFYQSIAYTHRILRVSALNKYKTILEECR